MCSFDVDCLLPKKDDLSNHPIFFLTFPLTKADLAFCETLNIFEARLFQFNDRLKLPFFRIVSLL